MAIYLAPSLLAARAGGLALAFGMTIGSGIVALALSQLLRRFRKLFPPEVSGVVVLMVGLPIVPGAMRRFVGLGEADATATLPELAVGIVTLGSIVALSLLPLGRVRLYSTLGGMLVGYAAAAVAGLIDATSFGPVADLPAVGLSPMAATPPTFGLLRWTLSGALCEVYPCAPSALARVRTLCSIMSR